MIDKPKIKPEWISDKDYSRAPKSITVREIKVSGKVLITSMTNSQSVHKRDLQQLYKSRWQIELDIRHIKMTLGMDILSCKTPEMALKEIWVYLLAYNLIRLLMAQSQPSMQEYK